MSGTTTVIEDEVATDRAGNRAAVRRGWILWLAAVLPAAAGLGLIASSLNAPLPESFGRASAPLGTRAVSLILSPSRRTGSISPRDRVAIDRALAAVAAELA